MVTEDLTPKVEKKEQSKNVCVISGKETLDKTKNIPLHREARPILNRVHHDFNEQVTEGFIKEQQETQGEIAMSEDLLRKIAPQYNKAQVLRMIRQEGGVDELFATLDRVMNSEEENEAE